MSGRKYLPFHSNSSIIRQQTASAALIRYKEGPMVQVGVLMNSRHVKYTLFTCKMRTFCLVEIKICLKVKKSF